MFLGVATFWRPSAVGKPSLDLNLNFLSATLDNRVSFSRSSTATRINASGLVETLAANAPRLDYDPVSLQLRGLLVEEARTNRVLQSGDLSNAVWGRNNSTITTQPGTGPHGGAAYDVAGDFGWSGAVQYSVTFTTSETVTLSIYAKPISGDAAFALGFPGALVGGSGDVTTVFNLSTSTVETKPTAVSSAGVESLGSSGWRRVWLTFTVTAGGSGYLVTYNNTTATGKTVRLWGAQIEQGAFPTSYIPTTTAAVTRTVDVASLPVSAFGYSQTAGTLVCEFTPRVVSGLQTVVYLDDTTNNERMGIRSSGGSNAMLAVDGGIAQAQAAIGNISAGVTYKAAMTYAVNDFAASQNGGTVATDTLGTLPTVTRLVLGSRLAGSEVLNGHLRTAGYAAYRMTNADLQRITS